MSDIKCEVIQDLLQLYIDDLCSGESCKVIEEHIGSCSECQEFLKILREKDPLSDEVDIEINSSIEGKLIKNIKKRMLLIELICLGLGAFGGLYTTLFIDQFKMILIYPIIGCIGYLIVKRLWATPVLILGVSLVGCIFMGRFSGVIMLSLVNCFLTLVGCVIGYLLKKIFEKQGA